MKILITTGIFPPDIGGPATQIEQLASDLVKNGFEVVVLTYGQPEKKPRLFKLASVSKKWPMGLRQLIFGFMTFYLTVGKDIIYTTDLYSPGFYSMLAAKFWRKKLVVRFAGDSAWETAFNCGLMQDDILNFQDKIYTPFIEKRKKQRARIMKSAEAVIAVSNFMKNLAAKIGVEPQKIHVIYNAVDFLRDFSKRQKPSRPTITFAGRLTPWKGVEMLIRVVFRLKEKYPDILLEVIGDGSELENLKKQTQDLKITENVAFPGRLDPPETFSIFSRSSIFVLNTNYEGLSHTLLEAMNISLPIITTPVGGNPELIENEYNGLLVPYNDEEKWVKAISRLLEDENLGKKFVEKGRKTLEKFKWENLLGKTIEVFNDICRK